MPPADGEAEPSLLKPSPHSADEALSTNLPKRERKNTHMASSDAGLRLTLNAGSGKVAETLRQLHECAIWLFPVPTRSSFRDLTPR
jgi:hypothetical protein